MNYNSQPQINNIKNMFKGKENYSIGLVFLTGYLLSYFSKMKHNNVPRTTSFILLFLVALACSSFV